MNDGAAINGSVQSRSTARGKRLLAHAADRLGLLDRLLWLTGRLGRRSITVLTYHRIAAAGAEGELDGALIEADPDDFEEQISVIRTSATVVSVSDLPLFRDGRPLPPNPVLITFDDGYVDNHDVALPILARAGVPATFFIPTAFPDAGKLFWWDRVALLFRRCALDRVLVTYPTRMILEPRRDPKRAASIVCRAVKQASNPDLQRLWDELESATGVVLSAEEERTLAGRTIMSWSEVRALDQAGMDVQSHSHSHLVLNTLAPDEARRDLARSAEVLREVIGPGAVRSVAYPVGYELDPSRRSAPTEANFQLGFTNATGLCSMNAFDPLSVPRVSMSPSCTGSMYKLLLMLGDRARLQVL